MGGTLLPKHPQTWQDSPTVEILVISSQSSLVRPVCIALQQQGFRTQVASQDAAQKKLALCDAAVLLCTHQDNHLEALASWRYQEIVAPLVALQFLGSQTSAGELLDCGADAVLTHPISADLLNAQLRALLRRTVRQSQDLLSYGEFSIKTSLQTAFLRGHELSLTAIEFRLLLLMMRNAPAVVHKAQLQQCLLHDQKSPKANALAVHMHHLRAKIGSNAIESVRSVGYRLRSSV
jgi:two-component system, OmpR family, response regulator QseB